MTIQDLGASLMRAGASIRPKDPDEDRGDGKIGSASEVKSPDTVEISAEARLLAARADERPKQGQALSEERILEIRRWIDDGFYDLPTTVEEVARRILASGDLDPS